MERRRILIEQLVISIAPIFAEKGMELQQRLIKADVDPSECTINGTGILDAYTDYAVEWAEAFADAIERSK